MRAPVTVAVVSFLSLVACEGGSGPPTQANTPPPVAAPAPTTTTLAPAPPPTTQPPAPAPTPDTRGTCDGVTAPNRCDVGSGNPPPTARCNDGLWSCSQNRTGTCSTHGGVRCWVCPGALC